MPLHGWWMKKLNRAMILICNFPATTLLWWSSLVSSWVETELPGDPNVLVSALFMDCSGKTMCWMPKHKPTYFILGGIFMISALLLSFCLNFLLLTFPQLFPETQKQYIFCASICIVTGALYLRNSWCCGAVRVLTSQPNHMDTISSEKTKLIQAEE
ncbi:transmembrane protein 225B-like [Pan troglodytes]|uniref:transmembrane protein 225B-like n=1 Tax=Pan troglodytes TaxID=9598 RepID=UPI0015611704